ncbi:MAG: NAD(P)H-hydrate dehydratase [Xanthomonadales bacterium]|nr:NAD(P)H-hydrate dehydratase [Xanthomonadales bacterium]
MPSVVEPIELYTVAQVRALEREAVAASGRPSFALMQRAGAAALASLCRRWPQAHRLTVFCGPGNNGGDGFMLAALARERGLQVHVVALAAHARGDAALAREAWTQMGGAIVAWQPGQVMPEADVLVDALYGIGLDRALQGPAAEVVGFMNASTAPVLALDVPSGLDADTGHVPGDAVRADLTVTFIAHKRGMHTSHAADCVGQLELATLDVPPILASATPADARTLRAACLPPRARYANKGGNGHVLVIGGAAGMGGAAQLAGLGALRAGAGLVSLATAPAHAAMLNLVHPELMSHAVAGIADLPPLLERASVLALGPGLGHGEWSQALWMEAIDTAKPLVVDADGLNLLASSPRRFAAPVVLTPHPGEAARLLGTGVAEVEADRYAAVRELARRYAAVVVLKGAGSLVADASGRVAVCPWGNPGMATGGMGDLLTGIVAALLAQGCVPWAAACLGVGLHARAGDLAARDGERGLLPTDLLQPLRRLGNAVTGGRETHVH